MRNHFKNTVHGVVGARCRFHFLFHARFGGGIDAGEQHFLFRCERGYFLPRRIPFKLDAAHADHMAGDLDAEFTEH